MQFLYNMHNVICISSACIYFHRYLKRSNTNVTNVTNVTNINVTNINANTETVIY